MSMITESENDKKDSSENFDNQLGIHSRSIHNLTNETGGEVFLIVDSLTEPFQTLALVATGVRHLSDR